MIVQNSLTMLVAATDKRAAILQLLSHVAASPMKSEYPPIGSKWKDRDLRAERTVEVIRYDLVKRRVRIHCIETQNLSWAKPERFNGKSDGYSKIQE